MPSLEQSFSKLRSRLKEGAGLRETGDDPVYYLIFDPENMLTVKRSLRKWRSRLQQDGWSVHTFSIADAIHEPCKTIRFATSGFKKIRETRTTSTISTTP